MPEVIGHQFHALEAELLIALDAPKVSIERPIVVNKGLVVEPKTFRHIAPLFSFWKITVGTSHRNLAA